MVNTDGTGYTVLYSFTNSPEGGAPFAGLTLSGSMLYGTTSVLDSIMGGGTVFSLTLTGPLTLQQLPDGNIELDFLGLPGLNYTLEWAHSLSLPVIWQALSTNIADWNGLTLFTNPPSI